MVDICDQASVHVTKGSVRELSDIVFGGDLSELILVVTATISRF
jgi:hypothetical protein